MASLWTSLWITRAMSSATNTPPLKKDQQMTVTISRLYDSYFTAQHVVGDLEAAGLRSADISIVASNADNWYRPGADNGRKMTARKDKDHDGKNDRVEGAE